MVAAVISLYLGLGKGKGSVDVYLLSERSFGGKKKGGGGKKVLALFNKLE